MAKIEIIGVKKIYEGERKVLALDGVNMKIEENEFAGKDERRN